MMAVKESMAKDETIVALHELEGMQEDLMKLFSERFGDLSSKVEELRSKIDVKAVKEIPVQMPKPEAPEQLEEAGEEEEEEEEEGEEAETKKKKKKPSEKPSPKTEAEKRIEEIRSEVEKVLDKLGQMEIET
jgi:outer membrane biosynthesis protein TonB